MSIGIARSVAFAIILMLAAAPAAIAGERPRLIGGGEFYSCATTENGRVLCWGKNASGQLGDDSTTQRLTPVAVSGLTAYWALAVGFDHACAIDDVGGRVLCWGNNSDGQLGNNSTANSSHSVQVSGLTSRATAIAAGRAHTCAIVGGAAKCWGDNSSGQLGDGTNTDALTPVQVSGLTSGVNAIVAGESHTCAVHNGTAKCWGGGGNGQLGVGTQTTSNTPLQVSGLASGSVANIFSGWRFTFAIAGGVVKAWGQNSNGQLGAGYKNEFELSPVTVTGLSGDVTTIAAGRYHGCALTSDRLVYCWGFNGDGQLGNHSATAESLAPIQSHIDQGVTAITTGSRHTCAVTGGGAARCWGYNASGQLGTDGTANEDYPNAAYTLGGWPPRDVDGDMKSDLVWHHATRGEVWLWPMDGTSRMAEEWVRTIPDTNWQIRAVADFDGDGMTDLVWRNSLTGQVYLWLMNGSTQHDEICLGSASTAYDIVSTGVYKSIGRADLLWRNASTGEVWLWLVQYDLSIDVIYAGIVDPAFEVVASGDLDGNGQDDIVWRQAVTGEVWVWLVDDDSAAFYVGNVPDAGYQVKGVADFTGDGKADILWHHATRGEVWIWTMDGATRLAEAYVGTVPDTGYRPVNCGDYDLDGKADIAWHHATLGEVWIWLMDGTTSVSETWVGTVPDVGYRIIR